MGGDSLRLAGYPAAMPKPSLLQRAFCLLLTGLIAAGCVAPTPVRTAPPAFTPTTAPTAAPTTESTQALTPAFTATPEPVDVSGQWLAAESFPSDPAKPGYFIFTFSL